jgi:hypothetical protein
VINKHAFLQLFSRFIFIIPESTLLSRRVSSVRHYKEKSAEQAANKRLLQTYFPMDKHSIDNK